MNTETLKPCPFCGGNKIMEQIVPNTQGNRRYMWCRDCQACGPWSSKVDSLDAAGQWNRRVEISNEF